VIGSSFNTTGEITTHAAAGICSPDCLSLSSSIIGSDELVIFEQVKQGLSVTAGSSVVARGGVFVPATNSTCGSYQVQLKFELSSGGNTYPAELTYQYGGNSEWQYKETQFNITMGSVISSAQVLAYVSCDSTLCEEQAILFDEIGIYVVE